MNDHHKGEVLPIALAEAEHLSTIADQIPHARGLRRKMLCDMIHRRLDKLIISLLDGFPTEGINVSSVRPVFAQRYDLTPAGLEGVDCSLIPLVIVRELFSRHKLQVRQADVPTWPRFADRFKALNMV